MKNNKSELYKFYSHSGVCVILYDDFTWKPDTTHMIRPVYYLTVENFTWQIGSNGLTIRGIGQYGGFNPVDKVNHVRNVCDILAEREFLIDKEE